MKLFERHEAEKTQERLPDLPPGVEVPDDISGIHPPELRTPTTGGVRWMRWLAAFLLLGAAGVVAAVILTSGDDAAETPAQTEADLMEIYGTDNPTFVVGSSGPGIVQIAPAVDYMAEYGTDNPVFVPGAAEANSTFHGEYMRLYGTDNPEIVVPSYMDQFGTDNPSHRP